jgi:hypothetical protein
MDRSIGGMDARLAVQRAAHRIEHVPVVGHRIASFG